MADVVEETESPGLIERPPSSSNYREATDPDVMSCGKCSFYRKGECTHFAAYVTEEMVCDEFIAGRVQKLRTLGEARTTDSREHMSDYYALSEMYLDGDTVEEDGLFWKEILPEGRWELTPDAEGKPSERPMVVQMDGTSVTDDTITVGLRDILTNFDDGVWGEITVPKRHANEPLDNTGYVRKLRLAGNKRGGQSLYAGMHFTNEQARQAASEGSLPGTSAGLLFNAKANASGKKYPVVLEHVALTARPWLKAMEPFTTMLSEETSIFALEFAEDPKKKKKVVPGDNKPAYKETHTSKTVVKEPVKHPGGPPDPNKPHEVDEEEGEETKEESDMLWDQTTGMMWQKGQVQQALDQLTEYPPSENDPQPNYQVQDLTGQMALVVDQAGDDTFVVPYTLDKGMVTLGAVDIWKHAQRAGSMAPNATPPAGGTRETTTRSNKTSNASSGKYSEVPSALHMAQEKRRKKLNKSNAPRGGDKMGDTNTEDRVEFSEEAQSVIKRQQDQIDAMNAQIRKGAVADKVTGLKEMGFAEYPGFLKEVEAILLADDGGEALLLSEERDGKNTNVTLSATQIVDRLIAAMPQKDGKLNLGEQHLIEDEGTKPAKDASLELSQEDKVQAAAEWLGKSYIKFPSANGGGE